MKVGFRESFAKDLRALRNKSVIARIKSIVEFVESASDFRAIPGLKKLRGESKYYRIKIGSYRLGLIVENKEVIFIRVLHRKDVYRYFP